jgi:DNA-binding NtrC family response regulator
MQNPMEALAMEVSAISGPGCLVRRRPRILVVEDDIDSWNLIQTAVHQAIPDARLQWASDAASARLALESCRFDAVLADYMLEDDSNGWTVLTECRRLQPDARVGMASAMPIRPPSEDRPCPFLRKPFRVATCAEFVKRLLT